MLGSLLIFLVAAGLIFFSAFAGLAALGRALNPNRPRDQRLVQGLLAAAALGACAASAAAGFAGIAGLWWAVQRQAGGA